MKQALEIVDPRLKKLERQHTWMWLLTAFLLLALGLVIVGLYFSKYWGLSADVFPVEHTGDTLMGALVGMLMLFSLYVALKQRELRRLRNLFVDERIQAEALRSRLSELTALFEMAMQANSQPEFSMFLGTVSQRMLAALEAQGSCILMSDSDTNSLTCEVATGPDAAYSRGTVINLEGTMCGWVAVTRETLTLDADEISKRFPQMDSKATSAGAVMCVPLETDKELVGVLLVTRSDKDNPFSPLDVSVVMALSEYVALAIRRIEEFTQLSRRTKQLELANRRLGELNRMKRVALSTVNHEIRTPLTGILSHAEAWLKDRSALEESQQIELVQAVFDQGTRLSDFVIEISDLLALELGSQSINLAPVSLNLIVSDNVLALSPRAGQKKVFLETRLEDGLPELHLDDEKLRRAMRFLISNSLRFATIGGRIKVSTTLEQVEGSGEAAVVRVADDGIGSSSRDLGAILPSHDSSSGAYSHRVEALGLGFYFVKEVVALHSGRVWFERDGNRAGICFSLPLEMKRSVQSVEDSPDGDWAEAA